MNETKAARFQRFRRRAQTAATLCGGGALVLVAVTPAARGLADAAQAVGAGLSPGSRTLVAVVVIAVALVMVWELAALPAVLYLARLSDRRYESAPAAAVDHVLVGQGQAVLVALPVAVAAALVWRGSWLVAGSWWWAAAGIALACLLALAHGSAPAILGRLAATRPLSDAALATDLAALASRAGVAVARIDEWQVAAASERTAVVAGLGRSRRVLVSSEILRDWSRQEVAVVVAHELAHHRYHDLWRALALDAVLLSVAALASDVAVRRLASALAVSGPADLAALPLVAVVGGAAWLALTPLRHAQSRRHERRADVLALGLTGGADAFSAAVRRLGARHLAEEQPSTLSRWLFHRHPSIADRLALADAYKRLKEQALT